MDKIDLTTNLDIIINDEYSDRPEGTSYITYKEVMGFQKTATDKYITIYDVRKKFKPTRNFIRYVNEKCKSVYDLLDRYKGVYDPVDIISMYTKIKLTKVKAEIYCEAIDYDCIQCKLNRCKNNTLYANSRSYNKTQSKLRKGN